jgi:hypothetical protein
MLLVSSKELRKALNKGSGGRKKGEPNLSPDERVVIGAAATLGTCKKTSTDFGVSLHHAHELKHAKHSQAQGKNLELRKNIDKTLDRVEDVAAEKLLATLEMVEDDELRLVNVEKKSKIAANLSGVLSKISSRRVDEKDKPPQVIFYAPNVSKIEEYDVIEVKS